MPNISQKRKDEIVALFKDEISVWSPEVAWITPKVGFKMRQVIENSIKNYYGIYDKPLDSSGKEKTFIPLTESVVEQVVKNTDLDLSDIRIRATRPDRYGSAQVLRAILRWHLRRIEFGALINELLRDVTVMGTAIAKVQKGLDMVTGKQCVKIKPVHPLNFIIDPTAKSIQSAPAVYERNVLTVKEAKAMPWDYTEELEGRRGIDKILFGVPTQGTVQFNRSLGNQVVPEVEVFERWGQFPLSFLTDDDSDKEWINGIIVIGDLYGKPSIQKIQKLENEWKPFEEARFRQVTGRFHGRGIGEILLGLQEDLNELSDVRKKANRVRHLGLWQIRRGAGVTQEQIEQLISSSAVILPRRDDISPLSVPEMPATAYRDEDTLSLWAERATGSSRMEEVNASQPATTSVLQDRQNRSSYALHQESFGFFLERLIERHYIPKMLKTLKKDEIINITGEPKDLQELDEAVITNFLNKEIIAHQEKTGSYPSADDVARARTRAEQQFRRQKDSRFIQIKSDILSPEFSLEVYITPETVDRTVMIQQLNEMLRTYASFPQIGIDPNKIVNEILDLMGFGSTRFSHYK